MRDLQKTNCLDVFFKIELALKKKLPLSVIRLGDREGGMLAFPDVLGRSAVDRCISDWFGHTNLTDEQALDIAKAMRTAVTTADIIGLPRAKQVVLHPHYKAVYDADAYYNLVQDNAVLTDAALHRYLQFTLLFRKLLLNREYVGLITPRNISSTLKEKFNVKNIDHYLVRGQMKYEGSDVRPHYPDTYNELLENLTVPFQGALFLVGAGGLGKVYCHMIKERGGVALDIGAIFDSWSNVKSRLIHPCHSIDCYDEVPNITAAQACDRFNALCNHFDIDTCKLEIENYPQLRGTSW